MDLLFWAVLAPPEAVVPNVAWVPVVACVYKLCMKDAWIPAAWSLGEQGVLPAATAAMNSGHQIQISCYLSKIRKKKSHRLDDKLQNPKVSSTVNLCWV